VSVRERAWNFLVGFMSVFDIDFGNLPPCGENGLIFMGEFPTLSLRDLYNVGSYGGILSLRLCKIACARSVESIPFSVINLSTFSILDSCTKFCLVISLKLLNPVWSPFN